MAGVLYRSEETAGGFYEFQLHKSSRRRNCHLCEDSIEEGEIYARLHCVKYPTNEDGKVQKVLDKIESNVSWSQLSHEVMWSAHVECANILVQKDPDFSGFRSVIGE